MLSKVSSYLAVLAVHYAYYLAAIQRHRLTVTPSALHAVRIHLMMYILEVPLWFRAHDSNLGTDPDPTDMRPPPTVKSYGLGLRYDVFVRLARLSTSLSLR